MSSKVVLITGASTGIGNLTARALAVAGHIVFASMRDPQGRNVSHSTELLDTAARDGGDLRVVELDIQSQQSVDRAVEHILAKAGRLDVVVHNAGHLMVGYAEAFSAEDVAHLLDVNVVGMQRVNRAVLPHLRERRTGLQVYAGSTTSVVLPPFLAPYMASKAAFDARARTTAYEISQLGIDSTIVMPGPFTSGTEHFQMPVAPLTPSSPPRTRLSTPWSNATRKLPQVCSTPPKTETPLQSPTRSYVWSPSLRASASRTVIDFTHVGVEAANAANDRAQNQALTRMGFSELLP